MRHSNGFVLVYVIVVMFALFILAFAVASIGMMQVSNVARNTGDLAALDAAQSGIAEALYNIQQFQTPSCGSTSPLTQTLRNGATFSTSATSGVTYNPGLGFQNCGSSVTAPDGTAVPPGIFYAASTGTLGNISKTVIVWYRSVQGWRFPYSGFGTYSSPSAPYGVWDGSGNPSTVNFMSDSYNSNYGPYNCSFGDVGCTVPSGKNALHHGDIGTNARNGGSINFYSGNTDSFYGDMYVGPGGTPGNPTVRYGHDGDGSGDIFTGSIKVLPVNPSLPTITDPSGGPGNTNIRTTVNNQNINVAPGQYRNLSANKSGSTLTLACGGYYSVKNINIANGGSITAPNCPANSPVKIFVYDGLSSSIRGTGSISAGNTSGTGLFIYGMGPFCDIRSCGRFQFSNTGTNYLSIYMPNLGVVVGNNATIMGSVAAEGVDISASSGTTSIIYDEALNTDPFTGFSNFSMYSWRIK